MVLSSGLGLCQFLVSWIFISSLHARGEVILDQPVGVNEDGDLVVEAGSEFSLTCRGDTPLAWSYNDYEANPGEEVSKKEIQNGQEHGQFKSTLTVRGAYFMDTGYVFCYPHDESSNSPVAKSVYLYVRGEVILDQPVGVNEDGDLVVEAGSEFSLTCRGDTPLAWSYNDYEANPGEEVSKKEIQNGQEHGQFKSTLTVRGAYFMDTGYVFCYPHDESSNSPVAKSVYLYVRDPENLLAINDTYTVVTKNQWETAVIPCRPTDPSLEVLLEKDGEVVEDTTFDPHYGIIFTVETLHQSGPYECVVKDKDFTFGFHMFVNIATTRSDVEAPHVSVSPVPVVEGMNITLECFVHHDVGVKVSLNWTVPDPTLITSGHIVSHPLTSQTNMVGDVAKNYIAFHKLTIHDVSRRDEGAYTCIVFDSSYNQNNSTLKLQVHNTTILELTFKGQMKSQVRNVEAGVVEAKLVVDIVAHPTPKRIQWYDNNNKPIDPRGDSSYSVKDSKTESQLIIHHPDVQSSGTYTLVVNNEAFNKSINATLVVKGAPDLRVNQGVSVEYFLVEEGGEIECDVFAQPRPTITWYFNPCDQYPACHGVAHLVPPSQYSELELNSVRGIIKSSLSLGVSHNRTGIFTCKACNELGCKTENVTLIATDVKNGFYLDHPAMVVESDNVTLSCGASRYNYTSDLKWLFSKNRGVPSPVTDLKIWTEETAYSYFTKLNIPNVTKEHSGSYVCTATHPQPYRNEKNTTTHVMVVRSLEKPVIHRQNVKTKWAVRTGAKVVYRCHLLKGTPPPTISWFRDGAELEKKSNMELREENKTLEIQVGLEDDATYTCVTTNKAGQDTLTFTIQITDKPNKLLQAFFMYVLPVLVIIVAILALLYARRVCKLRKEIRELTEAGLLHFEEGNIESLNPELDIGEQADLLPYDRKKWEFPRDKLKLGKQLGSGAFGVVLKAEAYGLMEDGVSTTVAVKMVKRNSDVATIKALASEVKIMIHLGKHLNVVNVLGACTGDLNKRELLVLVEYCQYGNLHNYLLKHRGAFINQVNPRTGMFDPTLIQPSSPRSPSARFSDMPFGNGDVNSNGMSIRTSAAFSQATDTTLLSSGDRADVSVQSTPIGDDGYLVCRDHEWRSNDRGDYRDGLRPICTQDLICWSFQIARGMEYLASRKVLHGDLAARNVLLADDNIVKICDFGFSKSMYRDNSYHKKGDGPLPVKWMALESIRDRVFSTQSDVWAYGITLWELFSLACTPYPGMEVDEKLFTKLANGYRMEQPKYATNQVHRIMLDCWHVNPHSRPSFTELAERLGGMLEDTVRTHYVDLNDPFLQENLEFLAQQDYLSMLRSPSYTNWNPEVDGYLPMKSPTLKEPEEAMELTPMLETSAMSDSESVPNSPTELQSPKAAASSDTDSPDGSPTITKPIGNNYVNVAQVLGFSNPSYHNLGRPKQNPYINMP